MNNKKYITIGTEIITKDIFRNILRPLDNYDFKPTGGLWASEYNSPFERICPWLDYLVEAKSIARYLSEYKTLNKGAIFTLKENANIITINNINDILSLADTYPSHHHTLNHYTKITSQTTIFNFEELSQKYDGIYINYNQIYLEGKSQVFDTYSINTLLLFNLDCIKEYQSVKINIDFEDLDPLPYIDTKKDISPPKKIANRSIIYNEIYNYIKNQFIKEETIYNQQINYDEYLTIITTQIQEIIKKAKTVKKEEIKTLQKSLANEGLVINEETIIKNIALNYLSEYLKEEEIKNMQKSPIKELKKYKV